MRPPLFLLVQMLHASHKQNSFGEAECSTRMYIDWQPATTRAMGGLTEIFSTAKTGGWVLGSGICFLSTCPLGRREIVSSNAVPALSLRSSLESQPHLIPPPCLYSAEILGPFTCDQRRSFSATLPVQLRQNRAPGQLI